MRVSSISDPRKVSFFRVDESEIDKSMLDEVGPWTIRKHEIVQYYAKTYANVLSRSKAKQKNVTFKYFYIDGFASAVHNVEKSTGKILDGSALQVLKNVDPPFEKYFFVEYDEARFQTLKNACAGYSNVEFFNGDANEVLPKEVFPKVRYSRYERAFCLLDPYKETDLSWGTVEAAAKAQTIDVLIHFPIYSMNINVLNKVGVHNANQEQRMTTYWGDESWKKAAYDTVDDLFGKRLEKKSNEDVIAAYSKRLIEIAGFKGTSDPIPMKNKLGNVIYYLIFASSNKPTGVSVIKSVAKHFIKGQKAA